MKLADICIERPVFATMLVMALVVLGAFSFLELGVDLFPKIDFPFIVIQTAFPGAGPEEVETQITKVIEEAVNTISGIEELRSTSFEGLSQVVVSFKLEKPVDVCAQDVRDRVGRVQAKLPAGVDPPVIERIDPDATPVIAVVVSSPMPIKDLTEYARRKVKEPLESVYGVGQIAMVGGREREVHVALSADRLRAYGLTPLDVKMALVRQNVELPGGLVETGPRDLVLRTLGRVKTVQDFAEVVVREVNGSLVRVGDVAAVTDSQQELRTMARLDGRNAISLVVQKQSGTNTVAVVRAVRERLAELAPTVPPGLTLLTVRDQSRFIMGSYDAVMEHLVMGAILASLVVLLFLGSLRTTIIVALSIPTSLIATFTLMRAEDFTLNQLTLLALALAVGLVVDDTIVVLENIFRHLDEHGRDPMEAAREGTREIGPAVMATTFSLVVIFLPIAFMSGIIGRFFRSFGLTMAFTILASLVVAFTLAPMLCSRFLRRLEKGHGAQRADGWYERHVQAPYMRMLGWSLRHRPSVVLIAALCMASAVPLFYFVSKDFVPFDDRSEFLIDVKAVEGTSIHQTSAILTRIEAELRRFPEVVNLLSTVGETAGAGVNEGRIYVALTPLGARPATQFQVMDRARETINRAFPDLRTSVGPVPDIQASGMKETDLNVAFTGPDLAVLRRVTEEVRASLARTPGVVDLDTSLNLGKPEVRVDADRTRAASLGVDLMDLASTLRTLVGGDAEDVTKFKDPAKNEEYEVRVRLDEKFRADPAAIAGLPIKARDGYLKLGDVAAVAEGKGPVQIERFARQRQVSLFANLRGIGLGEVQDQLSEVVAKMNLPPGYGFSYVGRGKFLGEMFREFIKAFILAALFVYMILAAQFESFVHPVTILLSLPLTLPFGVLSLLIVGQKLHLFSILGLFMLFGIVKKNAILVVDYTNTLRAAGMARLPAMLEANKTRLRPILMTTLTLVAGMIPMALGTGPGSAFRQAMGVVVIGGQTLCLLITLLITPVAYSLLDDAAKSKWADRLRHALD